VSRLLGIAEEIFDDPEPPGVHVPLLDVRVVALPDLEAGGRDPGAGFEAVAVLADGRAEILPETELSRLDRELLVGIYEL